VSTSFVDHQRAEDVAAEEIRTLGEPLLTSLTVALEAPGRDQGAACVALRVVGRLERGRTCKVIEKLLAAGTNDVLTREAVVQAMWFDHRPVSDAVVDLIWRWQGWGRQYPIVVARRFRLAGAVPAVIAALDDSSPAVRRHAARFVGEMAGGEALAPLRHVMKTETDLVARALQEAAVAAIVRRLPPLEGRAPSSRTSDVPIH